LLFSSYVLAFLALLIGAALEYRVDIPFGAARELDFDGASRDLIQQPRLDVQQDPSSFFEMSAKLQL
jgi:hypothetical protein